jgi:hypothetical protein
MVGLGYHAVLDLEARVGEPIGLALVTPPHAPQRVKGHHEGQAQRPLELGGHQAGQPEVGVNEIVAHRPAADEPPGVRGELAHEGQQLFLGHSRRRAGGHVHDAHTRHPLTNRGQRRAVSAREHVHLPARRRQVSGQLAHVDVLAPAVDAPRNREG